MNIERRILYKVNLDCYPKSADLSLKGQCHQMFDPFFDLQSLINSHSHGRYFINMLFFVRECVCWCGRNLPHFAHTFESDWGVIALTAVFKCYYYSYFYFW